MLAGGMFWGRSRLFALIIIVVVAGNFISCAGTGRDDSVPTDQQVKAVVTMSVLADMVSAIGGNRIEVVTLLPSMADPHTYEPPPRDVVSITQADVVFSNGLLLEGPTIRDIIEVNLPKSAQLVELAEAARESGVSLRTFGALDHGENDPHLGHSENDPHLGHSENDPHLWLGVTNTQEYARVIRDSLSLIDPEGISVYGDHYRNYIADLTNLKTYVQDQAGTVSPEQRYLVTSHSSFGYLADEISFDVIGSVVLSPGHEPSAQDVARLRGAIEESGVMAVFEEPQLGSESSILRQAAADIGVEVCTLYSSSLDDNVSTYIDLMRHNVDEIVRCLGGESPGVAMP